MSLYCGRCGHSVFRTSRIRLRSKDFGHILVLKFPVRCSHCNERIYTPLLKYLRIRREQEARHRQPPDRRAPRVAE
jgi:hypothetical protein